MEKGGVLHKIAAASSVAVPEAIRGSQTFQLLFDLTRYFVLNCHTLPIASSAGKLGLIPGSNVCLDCRFLVMIPWTPQKALKAAGNES